MSEHIPENCTLCNKKGLPILLTRYAIATRNADNLTSLFSHGKHPNDGGVLSDTKAPEVHGDFKVQDRDGGEAIDLGYTCTYTQRLLRTGFVYVYEEGRKKWKAYAVTDEGYLLEYTYPKFDFNQPVKVDSIKPCFPQNTAAAACITITAPAEKAGIIWIGFSDVEWTEDVFKKHNSDPTFRAEHMRKFNVAAWMGSLKHEHAAPIAELSKHVTEYCNGVNIKAFEYSLWKFPSDSSSKIIDWFSVTEKLGGELGLPYSTKGMTENAKILPKNTDELMKSNSVSKGDFIVRMFDRMSKGKGAIVAIDDPVGIASDLDKMLAFRITNYADQEDIKRQREASVKILCIMNAVKQEAHSKVYKKAHERQEEFRKNKTAILRKQHNGTFRTGEYRKMTAAEQFDYDKMGPTKDELNKAFEEAWPTYAKRYNESDRIASDHNLKTWHEDFVKSQMDPLAHAHANWMKSKRMLAYFKCNFDSKDARSGLDYRELFFQICIGDTQQWKPCAELYSDWIKGTCKDKDNLLMRALVLNQDDLVETLGETMTVWAQQDGDLDGFTGNEAVNDEEIKVKLPSIDLKLQDQGKKIVMKFQKTIVNALKWRGVIPANELAKTGTEQTIGILENAVNAGYSKILGPAGTELGRNDLVATELRLALAAADGKYPIKIEIKASRAATLRNAVNMLGTLQGAKNGEGATAFGTLGIIDNHISAFKAQHPEFNFSKAENYKLVALLSDESVKTLVNIHQGSKPSAAESLALRNDIASSIGISTADEAEVALQGRKVVMNFRRKIATTRTQTLRAGHVTGLKQAAVVNTTYGFVSFGQFLYSITQLPKTFAAANIPKEWDNDTELRMRFIAISMGTISSAATQLDALATTSLTNTTRHMRAYHNWMAGKYGKLFIKTMGVPAGAITVGWDISNAVNAYYEGEYALIAAYGTSAVVGIAGMYFLFATATGGVGLILIAATWGAGLLIKYVKDDPYEHWLERCMFGKGTDNGTNDKYKNYAEEQKAFTLAAAEMAG
jgi:hypothetical protein